MKVFYRLWFIGLFIMLISCNTIPVPENDTDTLLVIPVKNVKRSGDDWWAYNHILIENIDSNEIIDVKIPVDKSSKLVMGLLPGNYRVIELYLGGDSPAFSDSDKGYKYSLNINFTLKPKVITVLKKKIVNELWKKSGTNYMSASIEDFTAEDQNLFMQKMNKIDNYSLWNSVLFDPFYYQDYSIGDLELISKTEAKNEPEKRLDKILVIADDEVLNFEELREKVFRYISDINNFHGCEVVLYESSTNSPEKIKSILVEEREGLDGAIFIGDIPKAFIEQLNQNKKKTVFYSDFYFMDLDNIWFDDGFSNLKKIHSQEVEKIDNDWGSGSPNRLVPKNYFSARWVGEIVSDQSGKHEFIITSDDGRRVFIDGNLIIDKWIEDCDTPYTGTFVLTAGEPVDIVVEYFEIAGGANIKLEWRKPMGEFEVIPENMFINLRVDYYNNAFLGSGELNLDSVKDGCFDRIGYENGFVLKPAMLEIFVSRIDTSTSSYFGDPRELLINYFDRNHKYYSGDMDFVEKSLFYSGRDSKLRARKLISPMYGNSISELIFKYPHNTNKELDATPENWANDISEYPYLTATYLGHGSEDGLALENGLIDYEIIEDKTILPLFFKFQSCSPLRSSSIYGYPLSRYIAGAHIYGCRADSNALAAIGPTATTGGDRGAQKLYESLGQEMCIGNAFLEWTSFWMLHSNFTGASIYWFYPNSIIGDPMIRLFNRPQK